MEIKYICDEMIIKLDVVMVIFIIFIYTIFTLQIILFVKILFLFQIDYFYIL